jgi:DNA gyrase inhibitor GyrI
MKINVCQEHINRGERKRCDRCPIALAVKDKLESKDINVNAMGIFVGLYCQFKWHLPKSAQKFIKRFDAGGHVKPFTFEARRIK